MKETRLPELGIAEFSSERIKVIVFDVDDTVTRGTLGLKIDSWNELFKDSLEKLQEAREIYEFTGKGDRYNIIAHVVGASQENCQDDPLVIEYAKKFEEMTQESIRKHGIHRDDLVALIKIKESFEGPVYLLSATPEVLVKSNIEHFESNNPEIKGMFAGIVGTPFDQGKAGELQKIADDNQVDISEVVMIGDGGSDYNGALYSGCQFIGIIAEKKSEKWSNEKFPKASYISDVPNLIGI